MKRTLLALGSVIVSLIAVVAIANLLPFPLRAAPLLLIIVIWRIFLGRSARLWPIVFIFAFFLEIFRVEKFGTIMIAFVAVTFFAEWFANSLITNRTFPAWIILGTTTLIFFRLADGLIELVRAVARQEATLGPIISYQALTLAAETSIGLLTLTMSFWLLKAFRPRLLEDAI